MRALVAVLDALGPLGDASRLRVLHIARDFFDLPALPSSDASFEADVKDEIESAPAVDKRDRAT